MPRAIDASSRISILDLLRGLQEDRGVGFLYITHDIASARHFSNRIAVMYLGEIVEEGISGAIIDRPPPASRRTPVIARSAAPFSHAARTAFLEPATSCARP